MYISSKSALTRELESSFYFAISPKAGPPVATSPELPPKPAFPPSPTLRAWCRLPSSQHHFRPALPYFLLVAANAMGQQEGKLWPDAHEAPLTPRRQRPRTKLAFLATSPVFLATFFSEILGMLISSLSGACLCGPAPGMPFSPPKNFIIFPQGL